MAGNESWSMARIASRRPLPKAHALHANTVGERPKLWGTLAAATCKACGYHECACVRKREREFIDNTGIRPAQHETLSSRLLSARRLERNAVEREIDKVLAQQQYEEHQRSRAELQSQFDALDPESKKNINIMCAQAILKQGVKHVKMLEPYGGFHQNERLDVVRVHEPASGLVLVENHGAMRRGYVKASAVTW